MYLITLASISTNHLLLRVSYRKSRAGLSTSEGLGASQREANFRFCFCLLVAADPRVCFSVCTCELVSTQTAQRLLRGSAETLC